MLNRRDPYYALLRGLQIFPVVAAIVAVIHTVGWTAGVVTVIALGGGSWLSARRTDRRTGPAGGTALGAANRARGAAAHFGLRAASPLASLSDQVAALAHESPARSPVPLLRESLGVQDEALARLDGAHGQRSHVALHRLAGMITCVVADTHLSLGDIAAAASQIRLAWRLADAGDDDALRVWCASASSYIAYIRGEARQSVNAARAGHRYASTSSARQRLLSMEGNALALGGDGPAALEAFSLADHAGEAGNRRFDEVFDGIGGLFAVSRAKQLQNQANGLTLLGLAADAVNSAGRAVELFAAEAPQAWDYSLEAGSWVTLGVGYLMLDRADSAWHALQPALALPPGRRTSYVVMKFRDLDALLDGQKYRGSQDALFIRASIDSYLAEAVAA
jgi:hypothetical protein